MIVVWTQQVFKHLSSCLFVRSPKKTCSTLLYFSNLSPSAKNVFNLVILIFPCTFIFSLHIFRTCLNETYHRLPNNNLYVPPLRKIKRIFVFVPNRHSLKAGPVRLLYSQYTANMYQWGLFVVYPF